MLVLCLLCLALWPLASTASRVPPPDGPYNILMMLPITFYSHRNVFLPLATALSKRGHNITMLQNLPAPNNEANITYVDHGLPSNKDLNPFEIRKDMFKMISILAKDVDTLSKSFYDVPSVRELYDRRDEFDLVIFDRVFLEIGYPFVENKPFTTIATGGLDAYQSLIMGNMQNPAYVSYSGTQFQYPLSLRDKIWDIFCAAGLVFYWIHFEMLPKLQSKISERFPDLPPLLEMEKKVSLSLLNDNFIMRSPLPLLPSQVEIGGIQCRPTQPLPKDVETFLEEGPVIYFSLGSVAKGIWLPQEYQQIIVDTFASLPYKVLWKYEANRNDTSKNVLINRWLPQQDVLGHPNVKLFISHCGLLSSTEAMYHGTPILGLPVFADQPGTAEKLKAKGVALVLVWEELSVESFRNTIEEMMQNKSYQAQASAISARFKDQLPSPLDKAVYWTEYVIRHGGADHLRSPALDLSWAQLLHLDIILLLHVLVYVFYRVGRQVFGLCFGSKKTTLKLKDD